MKNILRSSILALAILLLFARGFAEAQTTSTGKWYDGTGSATGKNMEKIRNEALNRARADALSKAGVEVVSSTFSMKAEGESKLIDFFTEFAESNSRGLILAEKDMRFDRPVPLDSTFTFYRATAKVKALIAIQQGASDPSFVVSLSSVRDTYKAYEPVILDVKSTEPGYLTILDIHGDSITVLYPNTIDKKNYLAANSDFVFPPSKAYSLELETESGQSSSADIIIAIVTKDDIPFPNIEKVGIEGSSLLVAEKSLTTFANWLYRIPLDRRSADSKLIRVESLGE